ncbi:hypothetical protein [Mycoplasmopsis alligatoris]|uniref:Uncharacterized protein n=1 Tax=Mycoplasmopsis alligatoris A21JP2 TaxID=747682 RepID=D4XWQ8_9BACT|nr:hypothetical protein [Mycoplasmopsis alligatoris]EFF41187.1 hypothetical protein MALL_0370 [Mycoplasmopsis alligatoris A21JP2]
MKLNILTNLIETIVSTIPINSTTELIDDKNKIDLLQEEEKIFMLLQIDLLEKMNYKDFNKIKRTTMIEQKQVKEYMEKYKKFYNYDYIKKSLKTRKYYYSNRYIDNDELNKIEDFKFFLLGVISFYSRKDLESITSLTSNLSLITSFFSNFNYVSFGLQITNLILQGVSYNKTLKQSKYQNYYNSLWDSLFFILLNNEKNNIEQEKKQKFYLDKLNLLIKEIYASLSEDGFKINKETMISLLTLSDNNFTSLDMRGTYVY